METNIVTRPPRRRVRGRRKLLAGLLVAALVAATVAAPTEATAPGRNGRIAYSDVTKVGHHYFGLARIRTVRPNGSGLTTLTHAPRNVYDLNADWAPNGSKVVFDRETGEFGGGICGKCVPGIYTVKRDGSDLTRLTPNDRDIESLDPAYSPDGTRIAFDRCDHCLSPGGSTGIFVMDANGANATQVTRDRRSDPYQEGEVQWSPNGTHFVFHRVRRSDDSIAVFTARVNGTDFHRLTPWRLDADHADWSPTGRRIVLESYTDGAPHGVSMNVFTVRPDGSDLKNITHNTGGGVNSSNPAWSPTGKEIVFARTTGCPHVRCGSDIYAMKANGSHVHRVINSRVWDFRPDWGARP